MCWYFPSVLFQSSELFLFVRLFCIIGRYGVLVALFVHFLGLFHVNEIEISK